jgi:hypothetical protein
MRNRLKSGISGFFRTRRSQNWPVPAPPESLGMVRMNETAPAEALRCIIHSGQERKTEILAKWKGVAWKRAGSDSWHRAIICQ